MTRQHLTAGNISFPKNTKVSNPLDATSRFFFFTTFCSLVYPNDASQMMKAVRVRKVRAPV